ncbi:MAG: hypothetical protein AB7I50_08220 [Vicinamibacterales bacterium]
MSSEAPIPTVGTRDQSAAHTIASSPVVWLSTLLGVGFLLILITNSWVVDDAYITFRTVNNVLNGYGPTWNTAERVQAYSHPLWMMLITSVVAFTGEFFFTSIFVSVTLTLTAAALAAVWLTDQFRSTLWKVPLLLIALIASKAVIDFSSSGLEYPLSYLLVSLFLLSTFSARPFASPWRPMSFGVLIASLAFLTRPDTLVIYLPCLILLATRRGPGVGQRAISVALWSSPASLWVAFSLLYYGYPLPNTAYAKSLCTGYPSHWVFARGVEYAFNSMSWDLASHLMFGISAVLAWREPRMRAIVLGVLSYYLLVVTGLAATTHMSGRHFAIPFFLAIVVGVRMVPNKKSATIAGCVLGLYVAWSPVSALKFGTGAYQPYPQDPSFIDTKFAAYTASGALLSASLTHPLEDDPWFSAGLQLRYVQTRRARVIAEAIGFTGFAAGSRPFIIDQLGLSDPFLSRLTAAIPPDRGQWKSGHFARPIPRGYQESVEANANVLVDPFLKQRYDLVRSITRGELLDLQRLKNIWEVNSGKYGGKWGRACFDNRR